MDLDGIGIIDCVTHHDWVSQDELAQYLPRAWHEVLALNAVMAPGVPKARLDVANPFRNPDGDVIAGSTALGYPGALGVTNDWAAAGKRNLSAAVLTCASGRFIPGNNYTQLGVALCAAINDWTADRWLANPANGLWGSIIVPTQLPEVAAEEIRRMARHPRMLQVQLTGNGLSKPFGHPLYHPIYRAAADCGLPVAIHADADASNDTLSQSAAIGPPITYGEYRILSAQALMTHIISLIGQGVFEQWPDLKVLVVGGGIGWIPPTLWRADFQFKNWGRGAPWVKRTPSEYFRDNIRVATAGLEVTAPRSIAAVFKAVDGFEQVLCYGSGYPSNGSIDPASVAEALPVGVATKVLHENAVSLYSTRADLANVSVSMDALSNIEERPPRPKGAEMEHGVTI